MTVRLVDLTLPVLDALAAGEVSAARDLVGLQIPTDFAAKGWASFAARLRDSPQSAGWNVFAVVDDDVIVGDAGFKGGPDADGMVEIGYAMLTEHRRRGYAVAAVRLLLERAACDPRVRLVRAVVDPDNAASIGVVTRAGFVQHGDLIQPRDGRQLVFVHPPGF